MSLQLNAFAFVKNTSRRLQRNIAHTIRCSWLILACPVHKRESQNSIFPVHIVARLSAEFHRFFYFLADVPISPRQRLFSNNRTDRYTSATRHTNRRIDYKISTAINPRLLHSRAAIRTRSSLSRSTYLEYY